ncbi:MAG: ABC transporter substrate-binding protein [Thermodesulfobacteriota bacterium]
MRRFVTVMSVMAALLLLAGPAWAQGVLKVAITSSLNTLDPAKSKLGDEYLYMFMVFNSLTMIDRDLTTKPELAERWEAAEDLKTWTFHLRQGVKFHHGRELDAEDVVATIKRLLDKEVGSRARVNFLIVDKVEAVDKYTVRFTLNTPYAAFPEILGERQARVIPRDAVDKLTTQPIGTGPFMFKSFTPGDNLEMVKNPNYWEKGLPLLDGVILKVVPESAARVTGLETGELHVVWELPLESIPNLKKSPNVVVDEVPTSTWDGIIMHNGQKPFDHPKVRLALQYAVDKTQLVDVVLFGHGVPTHSPISPRDPNFNKALSFKPDLAKARKLLAEAGYPNGFEIKLYVPEGRAQRVRLGVTLQQMLKPIGVNIDVQRIPWDKFMTDIEGKATFSINGFFSRPTVDTALYPWYNSKGSWNTGLWHYKNPKVDELLDQARQTKDENARRKIYEEFQKLVVEEDPPSIVPYVINHVNGFRKEVKGIYSSPMMWFDLRKVSLAK